MGFNRPRRDAQQMRDDLVGLALDQKFEYLPLAARQAFDEVLRSLFFLAAGLFATCGCERARDAAPQGLFVEWLLQEIESAGFHGLHCQRNVAISSQNDHGHRHAAQAELPLKLDTAHLGHSDIGDQTIAGFNIGLFQKCRSIWKHSDEQMPGGQEAANGLADKFVVVDDE